MRRIIHQCLCVAIYWAILSARGQGTFQNLNFEQATVPDIPAGQGGSPVSVSNGVPDWNVYIGGVAQSSMFHNDISLGGAEVAIFGPQWFSSQILQGSYTVSLEPSTAGPPTSTAIGQVGLIPASAQSVRFYAEGALLLNVTFAGQQIPLANLGSGPNYTIFGGDVSTFANQTGELLFQGGGLLDNVFFSSQPIPEPSAVSLLVVAALVSGSRLRRHRKTQ